jgi:tripartite ATP-independent transporter DctP family solute receptor
MRKTALWVAASACALTLVLGGCSKSAETVKQDATAVSGDAKPAKVLKFKLADNQPLESPLAESNVKFAEYVSEMTNGAIEIEVYPNAQLGEEAEITEQVKAGVMDFARINIIQLTQFEDEYQVFTLPYMFINDAHRWAVTDGEIGQSINVKLTEKTGMHVLGFLDSGWRCFYTKAPVNSLADLKGMKIRVMDSAANIKMIKLLGATPTPMPYADVFTALQTGVIDGAENDYVSYKTSGHFEAVKYYAVDGHTAGFGALIMSDAAKKKLTAEQYAIIQECAQKAVLWQREAMLEKQTSCKDDVIKSGSVISEVNVLEFQNAVTPMYDDYASLKPIIEKIKALQ